MNRYVLSCLLSIFSLFICQPASALDIYGFGSYWEIEESDGTWGGGVGLAVPLFTDYLRLDGRAYFFENSDIDDDDELELLPIDFGGQIHLLPGKGLDPYILGGASYVYVDSDRIDVDSNFGAYVGGGLQLQLTKNFSIFGECVYRFLEVDSDYGFRDRDEQIDLNGITVNTGLKITL